MKITKLGHCCLLIETKGLRILTDPGNYSTRQNEVRNIDLVLITHEHQDHLHMESLKIVLKNCPKAIVVTNDAVGKILEREGIDYEILEHGGQRKYGGIMLEGYGEEHAEIYSTVNPVQNTGYFIDGRLFYPGDAFTDPGKNIDVLALPVAGPWIKISEAIEYALKLRPAKAFPVHDGNLKSPGIAHRLPGEILNKEGIKFIVLEEGKECEL
ncbi:MBL fold metallo-hydrolase [Candidatus Pacearchaeota archaeon]|nr:MBL fold metallo-hydrolase [Candidatus Pacearchaeota archaeon]